jgi:hypothetical protein
MSLESNVFFLFLQEEDSTEGTFSCICPVFSFLGTAVLFLTLGKTLPLRKKTWRIGVINITELEFLKNLWGLGTE